jgi:hypothetical protein
MLSHIVQLIPTRHAMEQRMDLAALLVDLRLILKRA